MTDFSRLLNPEQCAAATAGEGPILVLAAAGTGKTRTLVHRVAYLMERGVPASRILLLTFTNRAAREMLERAEQVVGPEAHGVWSGTFHSICTRFLRRWGGAIGYEPGFRILDDDDQKKLVGEIIKETIPNPKDFPKKEIVHKMISEAANESMDLELVAQRWQTKAAGFTPSDILDIANIYAERKRAANAMDFDDLLVNGLRLLKEKNHIRDMVREHFLHVLVDEYQDTNSLQAEFTDIIASGHRNIMAVGDDFQCIYTWRGANIENIMEFPERWDGCRIIKLERNYRSVPQILSVANSVMRDAPGQFEKQLRSTRSYQGSLPQIARIYNSKAQAQDILKTISDMHSSGYRYSDIAILYRSHFHSIDIEKSIHSAGIPYRLTSGVGFFEKEHVKDVLSYLRLMIAPTDSMSFMRFVRLLPGVGETSARKLWTKLGGAFNPLEAEQVEALGPSLGAKARPLWPAMAKAMSAARGHLEAKAPGLIVVDFIDAFYNDYLHRAWERDEAADRLTDVQELAGDLADDGRSFEEYLADAALMTNLDLKKNSSPQDAITLSTVHQAKGMEWPVVIVPWLSEGMFPNARATEEGRLDEERRLFYVVVTRAKDFLYMYSPQVRRSPEGGEFPVETSRYLKEIPRDLVNIRRVESYAPTFGGYSNAIGGSSRYSSGYSSSSSSGFFSKPRNVAEYKSHWRR